MDLEALIGNPNQAAQTVKNETAGLILKSLNSLVPGERFTALITDIKPGIATLRLPNGETINAKTSSLPDAHIGDTAVFVVRANTKGQIFLAIEKTPERPREAAVISESLVSAELPATKENKELVKELMKLGISPTKQTLVSAAFFFHSLKTKINGYEPTERERETLIKQTVFLIKEKMPPTIEIVEVFKRLVSGEKKLDALIRAMTGNKSSETEIETELLPEEAEAETETKQESLPEKLETPAKATANAKEIAVKSLFLEVAKGIGTGINKEKVAEVFKEIIKETVKPSNAATPGINEEAKEHIQKELDFSSKVGQTKEYFQLPFVFAGMEHTAEIHIFKKNKQAAKDTAERLACALIAVDFAYLGRIEVFAAEVPGIRGKNALTLKFSAQNDAVVSLLSKNVRTLTAVLAAKGYAVTKTSFSKLTEPSDVSTSLSDITGEDEEMPVTPQKYSFDVRV
ncbi:hypothetical protein FACS189490_06830 [Clostridia bacterium]|nr:hypothetical protein FACS189490_06830 [Clostridia bacterium]